MKQLSDKIKELRVLLGLTQENLAVQLDITAKSIQRYENGKSVPDTYTLAKLAKFFDVSADYLLGLHSIKEESEELEHVFIADKTHNHIYKQFIKCRNNYIIDENAEYYWINTDGNTIGGLTEIVDWADETEKKETRKLRTVIPKNAIAMCTSLYGKPFVLDSKEDVGVFLLFGGQAIIKKETCETYLSWFMRDFIV